MVFHDEQATTTVGSGSGHAGHAFPFVRSYTGRRMGTRSAGPDNAIKRMEGQNFFSTCPSSDGVAVKTRASSYRGSTNPTPLQVQWSASADGRSYESVLKRVCSLRSRSKLRVRKQGTSAGVPNDLPSRRIPGRHERPVGEVQSDRDAYILLSSLFSTSHDAVTYSSVDLPRP